MFRAISLTDEISLCTGMIDKNHLRVTPITLPRQIFWCKFLNFINDFSVHNESENAKEANEIYMMLLKRREYADPRQFNVSIKLFLCFLLLH
jgi:hypothetical protein